MAEFNIAPNTQIGKINIPEKVYWDENAFHIEEEKYSRGGEFIENLVTDNIIEFAHRWFKLANFSELLQDMDEYYAENSFGTYSEYANNIHSPILPTLSSFYHTPVEFNNINLHTPVRFNNERNKDLNYATLSERK